MAGITKEEVKRLVRSIKSGNLDLRESLYLLKKHKGYRLFASRQQKGKPMSFKEFVGLRLSGVISLSVANKEIKAAKLEILLNEAISTYKTAPLLLLWQVDEDKLELVLEAALDFSDGQTLTVAGVEDALELYGIYKKPPSAPRRKLVQKLPKEPAELLGLIVNQYTDGQVEMLDQLLATQLYHQQEDEYVDDW